MNIIKLFSLNVLICTNLYPFLLSDSDLRKINEESWVIDSYVDEFGDPSDEKFITTSHGFTGKFSNSATSNSILRVKFIIEKDSVKIILDEYDNGVPIKGRAAIRTSDFIDNLLSSVGTAYDIKLKDSLNRIHEFIGYLKPHSNRISLASDDAKKFIKILNETTNPRVRMNDREGSEYSFTIPFDEKQRLKFISMYVKVFGEDLSSKTKSGFVISLIKSTKHPYPFKLVSWNGNSLVIDDLDSLDGDSKPIRNTIEVGKNYKRNTSKKYAGPSLIECSQSDSARLFTIQFFMEQLERDFKTGKLEKIGRGMIRDYALGKTLEISSNKDVSADNFSFTFEITLPGGKRKDFSFTSNDKGKEFLFEKVKLHVSNVDILNRSITITKKEFNGVEEAKSFSF